MTTSKFSSTEWKQLVNAPQLVYHVLAVAELGTAYFTKRIETKALKEFLSSYRSESALVQAIIDGQKDADDKIEASLEEGQSMLKQVGALLEAKADDVEGDAVRDFLMKAGQAVAEAAREKTLGGGPKVSATEQETLDAIASALKATEGDKRRRQQAAVAAEASKRAAESKAKAEAEARQKTVEQARQRREAEAQEKAAQQAQQKAAVEAEEKAAQQARQKAAVEAEAKKRAEELKAMREAQIKKAQEDKPLREAMKPVTGTAPAAVEATAPEPEIYVVKSGDTLSGIAKSVYGKAGRWPEIFEANKDIIENPNLIRPGWKLRIPR